MSEFEDAFGRRLEYRRLSVTERCNFRCAYCLPDGCSSAADPEPLSLAEIGRLVSAFAGLGVWKVRLTGGEPTLRRDICEIVRSIAATPGVTRVGLTTNGYRVAGLVPELQRAGLSALNVSVDSLDAERFARVTGFRRLDRIVAGVEAGLAAGITSVKVNAVLLRSMDDAELDRFLAWTRKLPLSVRFIELMQTGDNGAFFQEHHLSAQEVHRRLESRGWSRRPKDPRDGPAATYGHADHEGSVGLIAPYSAGFCDSCNRVRVTATGGLRLCLFGNAEIPLRPLLQSDGQRAELMELISSSVRAKPASHLLREGSSGATATLASIGG